MADKQKRYASVRNPTVDAMVHERFRLPTREAAIAKLDMLRSHFVISRQQPKESKNPGVILWIKGYDVSESELAKGFLGHFALITFKQIDKGRYTLYPTKIASDLKIHPQRKYEKRDKHPNFGHPILRAIKNGTEYESPEDAYNVLMKLHQEYPEVSIPATGKLYIMIFSRPENGGNPVQKYVLDVKALTEGGFTIECNLNTYKPKPKRHSAESKDPNAQQGYFTSMVALKRSKKKRPAAPSE